MSTSFYNSYRFGDSTAFAPYDMTDPSRNASRHDPQRHSHLLHLSQRSPSSSQRDPPSAFPASQHRPLRGPSPAASSTDGPYSHVVSADVPFSPVLSTDDSRLRQGSSSLLPTSEAEGLARASPRWPPSSSFSTAAAPRRPPLAPTNSFRLQDSPSPLHEPIRPPGHLLGRPPSNGQNASAWSTHARGPTSAARTSHLVRVPQREPAPWQPPRQESESHRSRSPNDRLRQQQRSLWDGNFERARDHGALEAGRHASSSQPSGGERAWHAPYEARRDELSMVGPDVRADIASSTGILTARSGVPSEPRTGGSDGEQGNASPRPSLRSDPSSVHPFAEQLNQAWLPPRGPPPPPLRPAVSAGRGNPLAVSTLSRHREHWNASFRPHGFVDGTGPMAQQQWVPPAPPEMQRVAAPGAGEPAMWDPFTRPPGTHFHHRAPLAADYFAQVSPVEAGVEEEWHTHARPPSSVAALAELEPGKGIMSRLLNEFHQASMTRSTQRWELAHIYGHVIEFAGDQYGSRFIQQKLETANSDERGRVFQELLPNCVPLMKDMFGNYVIQKFFEYGDQNQKKGLAKRMQGQVLELSLQVYGCRVVQKALEHVLVEQQASMVQELDHHVLRCVKDQNGNHVIQKAIERVPQAHLGFIVAAFRTQVQALATHSFGCRVVQRLLEHAEEPARSRLLFELHEAALTLIGDQYGNYVVQHVIEKGAAPDREHLIHLVLRHFLAFAKQKFASNVVEKTIVRCTAAQRRQMMQTICWSNERGETALGGMVKDAYGNYVIQRLLDTLDKSEYLVLVAVLRPEVEPSGRGGTNKQLENVKKKMERYGHQRRPLPARFGPPRLTNGHARGPASEMGRGPCASMPGSSGGSSHDEDARRSSGSTGSSTAGFPSMGFGGRDV